MVPDCPSEGYGGETCPEWCVLADVSRFCCAGLGGAADDLTLTGLRPCGDGWLSIGYCWQGAGGYPVGVAGEESALLVSVCRLLHLSILLCLGVPRGLSLYGIVLLFVNRCGCA